MSPWTHPMCDGCWEEFHVDPPHRLKEPETETCCFCGASTTSGIYVRADPATVPLHSIHPYQEFE